VSGLSPIQRAHIAGLADGMSESRAKVFRAALGGQLAKHGRATPQQIEKAIEHALDAVQSSLQPQETSS
jgi:hypothetical protein